MKNIVFFIYFVAIPPELDYMNLLYYTLPTIIRQKVSLPGMLGHRVVSIGWHQLLIKNSMLAAFVIIIGMFTE